MGCKKTHREGYNYKCGRYVISILIIVIIISRNSGNSSSSLICVQSFDRFIRKFLFCFVVGGNAKSLINNVFSACF